MNILEEIEREFKEEFSLFEMRMRESLQSSNSLISKAANHFLQRKGKRIRPMIVFLSAKMCHPTSLPIATVDAAIAMELLHCASLIHDDVVDSSMKRHNLETLNALYDNKVAVLVGDYFLSASLLKAVEVGKLSVLQTLSFLAQHLAQGEMEQLSSERGKMIEEEDYFSIIRKKTASLFSSCAVVGALSVEAQTSDVERLEQVGKQIGLCFQIKDDIFDYFPSSKLGKPTGNDLREGKITLPLLYSLKQMKEEEREKCLALLSHLVLSAEEVSYLTQLAIQGGGIAYAEQKMKEINFKAEEELKHFPQTKEHELFLKLAQYIVNRDY